MARVVGVGHCSVDYLGIVDRYPAVDRKEMLRAFSIQGGGPVATALATLAAFGVEAEFAGKVADDDLGRTILEAFRQAGVGTRMLVVEPGAVSPFSFIAVERETGRRNVFWAPGSVSPLLPAELRPDALAGAEALLVDGHQIAAQVRAAELARQVHVPIVLDAGGLKEGMGDLLALTDVLIASERFLTEVAPRDDLRRSLEELRAMGPRVAVVTLGEEGSAGLEGEHFVRIPALRVQVVDTTGAGDVYHGAFLYGMLQRWDLERTMRFAGAAAGLKCRALGGRAGIPNLEEVLAQV
jgi:ribokinase